MTESQLVALEKAKTEKEAHGEFEGECPGYCCAGNFLRRQHERIGRIYQQTFIDTYSKVVPFFEAREVPLTRGLTDRGTE